MTTTKATGKSKKNTRTETSKKNSRKGNVSEVVIEKSTSNDSDANVSVFTKTTSPRVVIQSEKIDNPCIIQNIRRHKILKSVCLIVMGIILLIIFFMSLKTYNTVNEMYQILNPTN